MPEHFIDFENTVTALLSGRVICAISHEEEHSYLRDERRFEDVDSYLHRMGRRVRRTSDGQGFYLVYNALDNGHQKEVQQHFNTFVGKLDGLIAWLRLSRGVMGEAKPMEYGEVIRESELLGAIEESAPLEAQLSVVAQKLNPNSSKQNAKGKLSSVLNYLRDEQFLVLTGGRAGTVYRATAKWSLLYEQLNFIRQHDGLLISEVPVEVGDEKQMGFEL